jgi:hypothetical protein
MGLFEIRRFGEGLPISMTPQSCFGRFVLRCKSSKQQSLSYGRTRHGDAGIPAPKLAVAISKRSQERKPGL